MAETTWKQAVYDIADAYREAEGTTEKISIAELKEKVRDGGGKVYLDGERIKQLEMTSYKGDASLTIGQEGTTFEPNTLLPDGLQIVNGVNGEDLTETEARQDDAVQDLMRKVMRKVSDHNGEGEFVWKKMTAEDGDFVDYVVNSDETAYPDGGMQDGYWYELYPKLQSKTITPGASSITVTADDGYTLESVNIEGDADLIADNILKGKSIFNVIGTAIGQDPNVEFGVITLSSSTSTITINHKLGVAPALGFVIKSYIGDDGSTMAISYYSFYKGNSISQGTPWYGTYTQPTMTATTASWKVSETYKNWGAGKYFYILFKQSPF